MLGEFRLRRDQNEDLVKVGGKGLGADFILPEKEVAPWLHLFDPALVVRAAPQHPVANHGIVLLAARMADEAVAIGRFHEHMAAMARDYQAVRQFGHASSASTRDAHSKSVSVKPWTSWVLKRITQRL
jgi:hypothetical protein